VKIETRRFSTEVFGKFILAGEHAVLRGSAALVFPLRSRKLELQYFWGGEPLDVVTTGDAAVDLVMAKVIQRAFSILGKKRDGVTGRLEFKNSIPVGSGLGASAALCVALSRWLEEINWIRRSELQSFSKELENLFHGESSGVDVAVAINECGIHYEKSGATRVLTPRPEFKNRFYLSSTGTTANTSECVRLVKDLSTSDKSRSQALDQQMAKSVALIERALEKDLEPSLEKAQLDVLTGMTLAKDCFDQWGLSNGPIGGHMNSLLEAGAQAVKPTGSGGGGFVLSYWTDGPPKALTDQLIPAPLY
jgi:mevalonate kinase